MSQPPASAPPIPRDYYLLIPHSEEPRVLLLPEAGGWGLPHFRSEESDILGGRLIHRTVAAQWGLDATVLRCTQVHMDPESDRWRWAVFALENHSPSWTPPRGARWIAAVELPMLPLAHPEQQAAIAEWLAEQATGNISPLRPPWQRPGWLAQATGWIAEQLAGQGRRLIGPVEQIKIWSISCLLRGPTDEGPVYLKASPVLPLFANEPVITAFLGRRCPPYIPVPLAVEPEARWMLLDDFGDQLLHTAPRPAWEATLRALAVTQLAAVSQGDELLAAGCLDRRLDALAQAIEPLIRDTEVYAILPPAELATLQAQAPRLAALCAELAAYRVPPTLVHGDLHSDNVAVCDGVPLFFDWSDACVAHPFFDLVTLLNDEVLDAPPGERMRLQDIYYAYWADYESPERLQAATAVAARLGLLHQAISYQHIVLSLEPGARWELLSGWTYFLRRLLAALVPA